MSYIFFSIVILQSVLCGFYKPGHALGHKPHSRKKCVSYQKIFLGDVRLLTENASLCALMVKFLANCLLFMTEKIVHFSVPRTRSNFCELSTF